MNKKIRTRFAPSPTGFLHIGGLRTALFNYLIAKSGQGETILRIEDTDQKREVEGAVDKLNQILEWAGINFEEGPTQGGDHGPYIQSQRKEIYSQYAQELLKTGQAYYCFCDSDRLEKMRQEQKQKGLPPRYDGKCRDLNSEEVNKKIEQGENYVIRQKMPLEGEVVASDLLRGEIRFPAGDLEDHVLIKSDGMPTYQFASVVDDHLMEISHVVRGEEWLPSFPKNILLYQAFGWTIPEFIHLPVILDKDGGKLSKRKNNVAVEEYQKQGYLPQALINFMALLGWHPKDEQETLTLEEILERFNPRDIGTSPATFDIDKLDYFNGYHIRQLDEETLLDQCLPFLKDNLNQASAAHKTERDFLKKVVRMEQERLKKLSEIGDLTRFLFVEQPEYDKELLLWKKLEYRDVIRNLNSLYQLLEKLPEEQWRTEVLEEKIINHIREKEEKVGNFLWPMRAALTGQEKSPGPFEVADALGKEESLKRISSAIDKTD